jgi:glutathione S-transferase
MVKLYLGNKNYSSWSLRGWFAAKLAGAPFEEVSVQLVNGGRNPKNKGF